MFPRPAYTRLRDLNERVPALSFRARRLPPYTVPSIFRLELPEADRSQQSDRRPMAASQRSLLLKAKFFPATRLWSRLGPSPLLRKLDLDMRQGAKKSET